MMYDVSYWNEYARSNESRYSVEFATAISDLLYDLQCHSVLEVGCGTGIDLFKINQCILICGADLNSQALCIAKRLNPLGNFQRCTVEQLPYADSSIDFVFSHGLLSCLDDTVLVRTMYEMHRVARRYIMDCEVSGNDGESIDGPFYQRNMQAKWQCHGLQPIRTRTLSGVAHLVPHTLHLYDLDKQHVGLL